MPEKTSPEMVTHMISTVSRVYDANPKDVEALHDVVVEYLDRGPHGTFPDGFGHVADHIREIFPAVMQDSRINAMEERLLSEYARMPSTPETRLRQAPGDQSITAAAGIGAVILVGVVAATVAYCLSGPNPPPGESAPAHC